MSDTEDNALNPVNVTKYQTAADIANRALIHVLGMIKAGEKIGQLCTAGDAFITDAVKTVYGKGDVKKGIAFPTSVSIQGAICHLSPLVSDPEYSWEIQDGEAVRVELGVHIDGYIAQVATTTWVGASKVFFRKKLNNFRKIQSLVKRQTLQWQHIMQQKLLSA
jgi:methionine aminopeptidase